MARCFADEDFGYPIGVLHGTDYALFENGTIAKMVESEDGREYDFLFSSANQAEITFENPDRIPSNILLLRSYGVFIGYTLCLLLFYFIAERNSWSMLDFLNTTVSDRSVIIALMFVLWLLIGLFPEMIYEVKTRGFRDSSYIMVKHHHRPQSPKILVEKKRGIDELLPLFAYTQRLGISGSLLLYSTGAEDNALLMGWLGANIFIFSAMIVIAPLILLNNVFSGGGKKRVPGYSLSEFFELTEQKISSWIEENTDNQGIERSVQELLEHNEDSWLEFKLSMWTTYKTVNKVATEEIVDTGKKAYFIQDEILHTVAAFLNTEGGTLLIGVKDKPISWGNKPAEVYGVEADYKWLGKNNRDADGYIQAVYQVLNNGFGESSTTAKYVTVTVARYSGKDICRVDVQPLPRVRHGEKYIRDKSNPGDESFYVRIGSSSQKQSISSAARYIGDNFPGYTPSNN